MKQLCPKDNPIRKGQTGEMGLRQRSNASGQDTSVDLIFDRNLNNAACEATLLYEMQT